MSVPLHLSQENFLGSGIFQLTTLQRLNLYDQEVSLNRATLRNSWLNISASLYNNASILVNAPGGSGTYTIPDGYYNLSSLSAQLQNAVNTFDTGGVTVSLSYNALIDRNVLSISNGTGGVPIINISSSFGSVIGFPGGKYPSTGGLLSTQTFTASAPGVDPVQKINVLCNLSSSNPINTNTASIAQFQATVPFANQFIYEPPSPLYYSCVDGNYISVQLQLVDQLQRPIALDSKVILDLQIRPRKKIPSKIESPFPK